MDMAVPQFRKEFGDVIQGILQRTSERIGEQIDDVPDPQLLGQILEVMDLIPAERWKQAVWRRSSRASCEL